MRATRSLYATLVKGQVAKLTANTPTGLTGLFTHPSPRPHLIYLYNATLVKLSKLPPESVYRQSTESLTKHRLAIVENTVPAGLSEWQQRVSKIADSDEAGPERALARLMLRGKGYLPQKKEQPDQRYIEWDDDDDKGEERSEGPREGEDLTKDQAKEFGQGIEPHELQPRHVYVEDEPSLSYDQTSDIEHKIASGLIEEIVQVAQGELELVDEMSRSQVWEEVAPEDKPVEGQWDYFQRGTHMGSTQPP